MTLRNQRHIIAEDGNFPVIIQDQTSPALIIPAVQPLVSTTLSIAVVKDTYTLQVTSTTGLAIGNYFRIIDPVNNRFYQGMILNLVGTVVTTDTPLDFAYPAGSEFVTGNANMNVDGSVTPAVFKLRIGSTSIPGIADITRIMITCLTDTAIDLNKFGDITGGLTRGFVMRAVNGITYNLFNAKTNHDLTAIAYDFTPYSASNPALSVNGFSMRLTFNGQEKMGVALRVGQDENIEFWVQDDLTSLIGLGVILEGHAVVE